MEEEEDADAGLTEERFTRWDMVKEICSLVVSNALEDVRWTLARRRKRVTPRNCCVCGLALSGVIVVRPRRPETAMHEECWQQFRTQQPHPQHSDGTT